MQSAKCEMGDAELDRRDHEQLADRLLDFAARIGKVVDALPDNDPLSFCTFHFALSAGC
jgi:hypothetical protein